MTVRERFVIHIDIDADDAARELLGIGQTARRSMNQVERETEQANRALMRQGNILRNMNFGRAGAGVATFTRQLNPAYRGVGMLTAGIGGLTAGLGAFAAIELADSLREINELGDAANKKERAFRSLTRTLGEYHSIMENLRGRTGGILSDADLQSFSTQIVATQVATNRGEMSRILGLGTDLSAVLGKEVDFVLENVMTAILNMSYRRLDQIGLSAAIARNYVNQQVGQGIPRDQAFKVALIEQGEDLAGRNYDVIQQNQTSLDRLSVDIQNRLENTAQGLNRGLVDIAAWLAGEGRFGMDQRVANLRAAGYGGGRTLRGLESPDLPFGTFDAMRYMRERDSLDGLVLSNVPQLRAYQRQSQLSVGATVHPMGYSIMNRDFRAGFANSIRKELGFRGLEDLQAYIGSDFLPGTFALNNLPHGLPEDQVLAALLLGGPNAYGISEASGRVRTGMARESESETDLYRHQVQLAHDWLTRQSYNASSRHLLAGNFEQYQAILGHGALVDELASGVMGTGLSGTANARLMNSQVVQALGILREIEASGLAEMGDAGADHLQGLTNFIAGLEELLLKVDELPSVDEANLASLMGALEPSAGIHNQRLYDLAKMAGLDDAGIEEVFPSYANQRAMGLLYEELMPLLAEMNRLGENTHAWNMFNAVNDRMLSASNQSLTGQDAASHIRKGWNFGDHENWARYEAEGGLASQNVTAMQLARQIFQIERGLGGYASPETYAEMAGLAVEFKSALADARSNPLYPGDGRYDVMEANVDAAMESAKDGAQAFADRALEAEAASERTANEMERAAANAERIQERLSAAFRNSFASATGTEPGVMSVQRDAMLAGADYLPRGERDAYRDAVLRMTGERNEATDILGADGTFPKLQAELVKTFGTQQGLALGAKMFSIGGQLFDQGIAPGTIWPFLMEEIGASVQYTAGRHMTREGFEVYPGETRDDVLRRYPNLSAEDLRPMAATVEQLARGQVVGLSKEEREAAGWGRAGGGLLQPGVYPAQYASYQIPSLLLGDGMSLDRRWAPDPGGAAQMHTVQAGETLSHLAGQYGVPLSQLRKHGDDKGWIYAGQQIPIGPGQWVGGAFSEMMDNLNNIGMPPDETALGDDAGGGFPGMIKAAATHSEGLADNLSDVFDAVTGWNDGDMFDYSSLTSAKEEAEALNELMKKLTRNRWGLKVEVRRGVLSFGDPPESFEGVGNRPS